MPIFSNRALHRMWRSIAPVMGEKFTEHARSRLAAGSESAVPAEWEVATIYCLQQQGEIRAAPFGERLGDLDLIYRSRATQEELAVEVTALSDRALHARNPVEAFLSELSRITRKRRLHEFGGLHIHIGHAAEPKGSAAPPILGVPELRDFQRFFASNGFEQFLADIRAHPLVSHRFEFWERGADSVIEFRPGTRGGGGGYIVYTELYDALQNPIVSRLLDKDNQIKRARLALPAMVIMCDANCRALHTTMPSLGKPTIEHVVHLFLNGQPEIEVGPWKIQTGHRSRSHRINAVALWSLHEQWTPHRRGTETRSAKGRLISNESDTSHALSQAVAAEVASAFRHLPPIVKMPLNAHRRWKRPYHFGGARFSGGYEGAPLRAEFSLLTLQKLLAGALSHEEFKRAYPEIVERIQHSDAQGALISSARVRSDPEVDDDWIELVFDDVAPDHLFDEPRPEAGPSDSPFAGRGRG